MLICSDANGTQVLVPGNAAPSAPPAPSTHAAAVSGTTNKPGTAVTAALSANDRRPSMTTQNTWVRANDDDDDGGGADSEAEGYIDVAVEEETAAAAPSPPAASEVSSVEGGSDRNEDGGNVSSQISGTSEENAAAAKIQAGFRGHRVRKELAASANANVNANTASTAATDETDSAEVLAGFDGVSMSSMASTVVPNGGEGTAEEHAAATKIQAAFKGSQLRKSMTISAPVDAGAPLDAGIPTPEPSLETAEEETGPEPEPEVANRPRIVFGAVICQMNNADVSSGNRVPLIVYETIEYIKSKGLDSTHAQGIFRKSANAKLLAEVKSKYNAGEPVDFEQLGQVSSCANALKAFFRELLEPVINTSAYPLIIQLMDTTLKQRVDIGGVREGGDVAEMVATVRSIFQTHVDGQNLTTLRVLFIFLAEIASFSDSNSMTVKNLALVFGPNMLWAEGAGPNSKVMPQLAHLKHASDFLEFVLDYQNAIFAGVEKEGYVPPAQLAPDMVELRAAAAAEAERLRLEAAVAAQAAEDERIAAEKAEEERVAAEVAAAAQDAEDERIAAEKAEEERVAAAVAAAAEAAEAEAAAEAEMAALTPAPAQEGGMGETPTGFDDISMVSELSAMDPVSQVSAEKRRPLTIEEVVKRPIVAENWSGSDVLGVSRVGWLGSIALGRTASTSTPTDEEQAHLLKAAADIVESAERRGVQRAVLVVSDSVVGLVRGGVRSQGTIMLKNNASEVQLTLQDDDNVHFVAYVTVNELLQLKHLHVLMTTSAQDRDAVVELLNKVAGKVSESEPSEGESAGASRPSSPSGTSDGGANDDDSRDHDIYAVRYLGRAPVSVKTWWDSNSDVLGDISKAAIEQKTMNDLFNAATAVICAKAPPGTARADGICGYVSANGNCRARAEQATLYCSRHTCTHQGCTSSKASSDQFCTDHIGAAAAATPDNVPAPDNAPAPAAPAAPLAMGNEAAVMMAGQKFAIIDALSNEELGTFAPIQVVEVRLVDGK